MGTTFSKGRLGFDTPSMSCHWRRAHTPAGLGILISFPAVLTAIATTMVEESATKYNALAWAVYPSNCCGEVSNHMHCNDWGSSRSTGPEGT